MCNSHHGTEEHVGQNLVSVAVLPLPAREVIARRCGHHRLPVPGIIQRFCLPLARHTRATAQRVYCCCRCRVSAMSKYYWPENEVQHEKRGISCKMSSAAGRSGALMGWGACRTSGVHWHTLGKTQQAAAATAQNTKVHFWPGRKNICYSTAYSLYIVMNSFEGCFSPGFQTQRLHD